MQVGRRCGTETGSRKQRPFRQLETFMLGNSSGPLKASPNTIAPIPIDNQHFEGLRVQDCDSIDWIAVRSDRDFSCSSVDSASGTKRPIITVVRSVKALPWRVIGMVSSPLFLHETQRTQSQLSITIAQLTSAVSATTTTNNNE